MATNAKIFQPANRSIVDGIKKELRLQGHYLTGALEASLKEKQISENGGITLTAEALEYLNDLEVFTPADKINLSEAQFQKLRKWVILRGLSGPGLFESGQVASAIYTKWKQEGRSTIDSAAYSATGERHEAVKTSFEANESKYFDMIDDAAIGSLDSIFNSVKSGTI